MPQNTDAIARTEVNRLIKYIERHAVDSEQTSIQPDEVPLVVNQLFQQLIWGYPCLDQVLQELLDNLRFQV